MRVGVGVGVGKRQKRLKRWKRMMKLFGKILGVALIAGIVFQIIEVRRDAKELQPPGQMVEVDGKSMHVYAEGEGAVTVVLVSGWGTVMPYVDYYPLMKQLSPHVKVVVYDRFGSGYSDLTDRKRDIDSITDEIHDALEKSGQRPPYIFVGHSLGSLEAVRFAQRYEGEVQGLLLIDGGTPEYYAEMSPVPMTVLSYAQRLMIHSGAARLLSYSDSFMNSMNDQRNELLKVPEQLRELDRIATLRLAVNKNVRDEIRHSQDNARTIIEHGKAAGDKKLKLPLTALTADYFGHTDVKWKETQPGWKDWSVESTVLTVKDTHHYVHQYEPERVAEEILKLAVME